MIDFIFLSSKIIVEGDCSCEINSCLFLGRKAMTKLDSILKSRDITLSTKVYLVKAVIFPVVMHGYESWTVKKAECQRIDAFELWCWRRLLRVPWTARRSNQSILKEINLEYSLEGLMLKPQYFGYLMPRADSLEKTLMLGKSEGRRRSREGNGTPLQYSCLENPMDGGAWWTAVYGVTQSRSWLKRLSSSSSRRGW